MTIIGSIQYLARSVVFGGIILTATMGSAYAAQAPADHDLDYWQALSHTHYIEEGSKGPILYDFFDPNCPYCHQVYTWLQNPIDNGRLRVRFIVVGFLTHSSKGKASAILAASNPLTALKQTEMGFTMTKAGPDGGIDPASAAVIAKMQDRLHFNKSRLQGKEFQIAGAPVVSVPFLVYRNGKTIHYIFGLPDNAQWRDLLNAS
jgi:thiol:disulfide interchange protein DsbG